MSLVKGPFEIKFGADVLAGIEELSFEYDVDSSDHSTVQGRRYQVAGTHLVTVTATFLESDVPSLAVVLPQYFVPNGGTLSTGETVNNANGAIDIVPGGCDVVSDPEDVIITSCNGHVLRIPECSTEISAMDFADNVRTVSVIFRGESEAATVQLFAAGAVTIVS